ncbi:DNA (cytosine-5-)-methyltransferase, partial [Acinetobacter variabilis]|uniref:DNA cytosine methyltransferase n=1 Tax=Acinetobacter variabilis TaxID=70346 RepID=UPI0028A6E7A1
MIGIDLFSGAGGLSLGAIQAGINVEYAVELDKKAALTCSSNHTNLKMFNKDITLITADDFSKSYINNNDLILFGGPPCQGFSTSNQRNRNKNNLKNWLFKEFIRLARDLEPNYIVIENVKGLLETENKLFYESIVKDLSYLGYKISPFLLNAVDYGVPQNRTRLFIIGSKKGKKIQEPIKHNKKITVSEALLDLPDVENGNNINALPYRMSPHSEYSQLMRECAPNLVHNNLVTKSSHQIIERYSHIPQGGNWENIPEQLMMNYKDR